MPQLRHFERVAGAVLKVAPPIFLAPGLFSYFKFAESKIQSFLPQATEDLGIANTASGHKMAWRSSGASNADLVANLAENGLINSDRVKQAMLGVGPSVQDICR